MSKNVYVCGIDDGRSEGDECVVAVIKKGRLGKPDELIASLTWEQAKSVARAVQKAEPTITGKMIMNRED